MSKNIPIYISGQNTSTTRSHDQANRKYESYARSRPRPTQAYTTVSKNNNNNNRRNNYIHHPKPIYKNSKPVYIGRADIKINNTASQPSQPSQPPQLSQPPQPHGKPSTHNIRGQKASRTYYPVQTKVKYAINNNAREFIPRRSNSPSGSPSSSSNSLLGNQLASSPSPELPSANLSNDPSSNTPSVSPKHATVQHNPNINYKNNIEGTKNTNNNNNNNMYHKNGHPHSHVHTQAHNSYSAHHNQQNSYKNRRTPSPMSPPSPHNVSNTSNKTNYLCAIEKYSIPSVCGNGRDEHGGEIVVFNDKFNMERYMKRLYVQTNDKVKISTCELSTHLSVTIKPSQEYGWIKRGYLRGFDETGNYSIICNSKRYYLIPFDRVLQISAPSASPTIYHR